MCNHGVTSQRGTVLQQQEIPQGKKQLSPAGKGVSVPERRGRGTDCGINARRREGQNLAKQKGKNVREKEHRYSALHPSLPPESLPMV